MTTKPNLITYDGETMSVNAWAKRIGVSSNTLHYRLKKGWPLDKALTCTRFTYRIKDQNTADRQLAYRAHLEWMQDQFDSLMAAFVRNVESDARRLRRQMKAMIAERTSIPDHVLMHRGVVSQLTENANDRSLSVAQDRT